jgi:hypothetical protein
LLLKLRQAAASMVFDQNDYLSRATLGFRPLILGSLAKAWLLRVDGVYK